MSKTKNRKKKKNKNRKKHVAAQTVDIVEDEKISRKSPKLSKKRKMIIIAVAVVLIAAAVAVVTIVCLSSTSVVGEVDGNKYSNSKAGFTFTAPDDFIVKKTDEDFIGSAVSQYQYDEEKGLYYSYLTTAETDEQSDVKLYSTACATYDNEEKGSAQLEFVYFESETQDSMDKLSSENALYYLCSPDSFNSSGYTVTEGEESTVKLGSKTYDTKSYTYVYDGGYREITVECLCAFYKSGKTAYGVRITALDLGDGYTIEKILSCFD